MHSAIEGEVALTIFDPIVDGHWKKKSEEMLNRIGWGDLDSDEETIALLPELAERNDEREQDSDDDSTQATTAIVDKDP